MAKPGEKLLAVGMLRKAILMLKVISWNQDTPLTPPNPILIMTVLTTKKKLTLELTP